MGILLDEVDMSEEEKIELGLTRDNDYTVNEIYLCEQFKVFRKESTEDEYVRKITTNFRFAVENFGNATNKTSKAMKRIKDQLKKLCIPEGDAAMLALAENRKVNGEDYTFKTRRDFPQEELRIALLVANKEVSNEHPLFVSYTERDDLRRLYDRRNQSVGRIYWKMVAQTFPEEEKAYRIKQDQEAQAKKRRKEAIDDDAEDDNGEEKKDEGKDNGEEKKEEGADEEAEDVANGRAPPGGYKRGEDGSKQMSSLWTEFETSIFFLTNHPEFFASERRVDLVLRLLSITKGSIERHLAEQQEADPPQDEAMEVQPVVSSTAQNGGARPSSGRNRRVPDRFRDGV